MQVKLDAAKAMTFAARTEHYIASHKAGWCSPSAAPSPVTLGTYVYPLRLLNLPAAGLT
jgi:hypothetical protein